MKYFLVLLLVVWSVVAEWSPDSWSETACGVQWRMNLERGQLRTDVSIPIGHAFRFFYLNDLQFKEGTKVQLTDGGGDVNARPRVIRDGDKWLVTIPVLKIRSLGQIMYQLMHELGHVWLSERGYDTQKPEAEAFCGWLSVRGIEFLSHSMKQAMPHPQDEFRAYVEGHIDHYNELAVSQLEERLGEKAADVRMKDLKRLNADEAALYGHLIEEREARLVLRQLGIELPEGPLMSWEDIVKWRPGDPVPERKPFVKK